MRTENMSEILLELIFVYDEKMPIETKIDLDYKNMKDAKL
jgi:hypothetical protein